MSIKLKDSELRIILRLMYRQIRHYKHKLKTHSFSPYVNYSIRLKKLINVKKLIEIELYDPQEKKLMEIKKCQ